MADTRTDANPGAKPADDTRVRYPANSVIAIIDTPEALEATHTALTHGGFLESEVAILAGEDTAQALRDNTGRRGLANIATRVVAALGMPDDETITRGEYADALAQGRFVVMVQTPTDERKELAARVLQQHGGKFVNFLSQNVIERMGDSRRP